MSLVKLVRGRQFQYQNVFRTISFGYMPFLPMSQSYKMELDGASQASAGGASPRGYWNLAPQEEYKKAPGEGSYPWMIRRFAYNQGGSGRLSPLNSYNRQEMALQNTPKSYMAAQAKAMGADLQKLLEGANAVGERQYEAHDIAELELTMIGDLIDQSLDSAKNPLVQRPNQYRKTMGITDDTFKQLSSQSFDFVFDKHPGVQQATMGVLGKAGGTEATKAAKGAVGLEMTAASPENKFLVTSLKGIFDDIDDAQTKTESSVATQLAKINEMLSNQIKKSPMVTQGLKPTELKGAPVLRQGLGKGVQQQFTYTGFGTGQANVVEDAMSTYHYLYTEIRKSGNSKLHKEANRMVSRIADMVNYEMMKGSSPNLKQGKKWIEHLNIGGGYQALVILDTFMKTLAGTVGMGKVPQIQTLGVYVINADSLAQACRKWAKKSLFAKVKGINKTFRKLHQKAVDESVKTATRIDLAGTVLTYESIEKMLGGVELYVGDAGGYSGQVGLTTTTMAEGLGLQLERAMKSGEFQDKFGKFYSKMMDGSNKLSTQWKRSVPQGTTSDALISEEWTFGDGRQAAPPGGPRKHFLGIWGPTGDASGKYINWRDSQRRVGENISISPFLTSRRQGTGMKELFGQG